MDGSSGGAFTRAELISLLIRLGVATAVSLVSLRYMLKYLDPNHAAKEQAEKQVESLFSYAIGGNVSLGVLVEV